MIKLIKNLIAILVLSINMTNPVMAQAPIKTEPSKVLSVGEIIDIVAPQFGQDPKLISKIIYCESGHKVVSHDGGRARNVTGIHDTTFKGWLPMYIKDTGDTLDMGSTYDQIKMMSWAFKQGSSYRNQWTTYVAFTKGGTYSFYSSLMQRHYTARCV